MPKILPLPDLLYLEPHLGVDRQTLEEVLGMAALGRQVGTEFHDILAKTSLPEGCFVDEFFKGDLFLGNLVKSCCNLELDGRDYPVNHSFLERSLGGAPLNLETTRFRQQILRELDDDPEALANTEELYVAIFDLVMLHRTPSYQTHLDLAAFHLDILKQSRVVVDFMAERFGEAKSGLRRLHESAVAIQRSNEYKTLCALLEYESGLAKLQLDVTIGGEGRIRKFNVRKLEENRKNPLYTPPGKRFIDRVKLAFNGYSMSNRELMTRLINDIYRQISPHFVPLVQLTGHLEFYLTARSFRDVAREAGLEMVLADFDDHSPIKIEGLFNPLLLSGDEHSPVECRLELQHGQPITIITGPNSGGKTRLLQAIGLTQLLGQSGVFVPAREARLRHQHGLFVSLVEDETAEQTEGRLGRELVRIRLLFEEMAPGSMVILDELCSGTNPSEGIEVFEMVLELLADIAPSAFVTTHFLDFARSLAEREPLPGLEFRQVEIDDSQRSTYQFIDGVADTSLARVTAQRLGVTFERLSEIIQSRGAKTPKAS